jgi:TolA-binding protein
MWHPYDIPNLYILELNEALVQLLIRLFQSQEQTQERQTDILQQLVQSEEGNDAQGKAQGGLRKFLRLRPSVFSGSANPFDAEDWLNEMNFEAMHCPHQDKVTLTTFMLQCGAVHFIGGVTLWC